MQVAPEPSTVEMIRDLVLDKFCINGDDDDDYGDDVDDGEDDNDNINDHQLRYFMIS